MVKAETVLVAGALGLGALSVTGKVDELQDLIIPSRGGGGGVPQSIFNTLREITSGGTNIIERITEIVPDLPEIPSLPKVDEIIQSDAITSVLDRFFKLGSDALQVPLDVANTLSDPLKLGAFGQFVQDLSVRGVSRGLGSAIPNIIVGTSEGVADAFDDIFGKAPKGFIKIDSPTKFITNFASTFTRSFQTDVSKRTLKIPDTIKNIPNLFTPATVRRGGGGRKKSFTNTINQRERLRGITSFVKRVEDTRITKLVQNISIPNLQSIARPEDLIRR